LKVICLLSISIATVVLATVDFDFLIYTLLDTAHSSSVACLYVLLLLLLPPACGPAGAAA
jgi:hypothetical protein